MKRFLGLLLAAVLVIGLVLTGCSGSGKAPDTNAPGAGTPGANTPQQAADTSLEDVKAAGKIKVGLDDAFAPMGFRDEKGEIVGFDVDMAKEAARRMGVEAEFIPIDWASKEMELNNKNIDMIWNGLTITEERKKNMLFTDPYLENLQIIVVQAGSDIKNKSDLAGKKVGTQTGSSSNDALEADEATFKSLDEVVGYPDNLEALMDLATGRIAAVVVDEVLGRYYISKNPEKYKVLEDHFGSEEYGVGLRLTDKALRDELQRVLDEMKADGTSAEISKKWFGEDIVK